MIADTAGTAQGRAQEVPLSVRLREATREAHERVETTASFNRLIVVRLPGPSIAAAGRERRRLELARLEYREVYRRFLVASYGFESAVDAALAASPARPLAESLGFTCEPLSPTGLIRDDLRRVFGETSLEPLAVMDGLAPVHSLAEFVGTEYVRRGSRAGGAVVGAVVHQNLGLSREFGASFLLQHGKSTRKLITDFKNRVDGLGLPPPEASMAVATAIATFEAIQGWHSRFERTLGTAKIVT